MGYDLGLNPPEEEPLSDKSRTASAQPDTQTPSKPAQTSPAFYYGVCPLWEDVLARNGEALLIYWVDLRDHGGAG